MELISNNGYGLYFMKLGGALAAKIIDSDRQQLVTPIALRLLLFLLWMVSLVV